ncbi:TetR/AcrR family transcriptional regulator [Acinetobacter gerneri]|uniref:TetR/AcrR family transcriptional regulator n=1 Tax=Acinetobacter gerneri TaxID=202952 RepID=UPI0028AFFA6F|nr:TetR/AcrR family transcriptional regulator [Acinetobacter gerneri]
MIQSTKKNRSGGRALEVVNSVHKATIELIQELGYEQTEIPAIAERAGVNKTSIYRRWPNKADLVIDVALTHINVDIPIPNTGCLSEDLFLLLKNISITINTPFAKGVLIAIITHQDDINLNKAQTLFWNERYDHSSQIIQRAIARKELTEDTNCRLMLEIATAPLFHSTLLTGRIKSDSEIKIIVDKVILAFKNN